MTGDCVLDDGQESERSPTGSDPDSTTDQVAAAAALEQIRDRATTVRDRELETALARLDARGPLSPAEREAVETLANRLVDRLLAVPEESLRDAEAGSDEETVETALELFG